MAIYFHPLGTNQGNHIVAIEDESLETFKQLVQRGANLWPDAPPEIKEFADLVTNGTVLQDYRGQDTSQKKESNNGTR